MGLQTVSTHSFEMPMVRVSLPIRIVARPPEPAQRDRTLALIEARALERPEELSGESDANVLAWLALNGGPQTRRVVASNLATPVQANLRLAEDDSTCVRAALAVKIGQLAPTSDSSKQARETFMEIVERLARDASPRVRAALSHSIASLAWAPREAVKSLAHDEDIAVAGPVLECSPLVSEADLLQIIVTGRSPAALALIARRKPLSEDVCDAIALIQDEEAVRVLLENSEASIRLEALDHIAEQADAISAWHAPLAAREDLSLAAIRKIATFLDAPKIERLADRQGLDDEMRIFLYREMLSRRSEARVAASADAELAASAVAVAQRAGTLGENFIREAACAGQRETVVAALSQLAAVPTEVARRILSHGAVRPVTALVRRAGLSMRSDYAIQNLFMNVPAREQFPVRRKLASPRLRLAALPWWFGRVRSAT
jgi:uncharacterized protein (DUF2336 family)